MTKAKKKRKRGKRGKRSDRTGAMGKGRRASGPASVQAGKGEESGVTMLQ